MSIITIKRTTLLQSPYLHLSAVGHSAVNKNCLRWLFRGILGENHLPKGNYAQSNYNFNKRGDFVKIYRAKLHGPYVVAMRPLPAFYNCLLPTAPEVIDNDNCLWSYHYSGKLTYLKFLEKNKYIAAQNIYNPVSIRNYNDFIQYYIGNLNGIIEIEFPNDVFCEVISYERFLRPPVAAVSNVMKMEVMSVNDNSSLEKYVYARKTYRGSVPEFSMFCENGKSIRIQADSYSMVPGIMLYFYNECIGDINGANAWEELGDFALNLDDRAVFSRLEPQLNLINGVWERFNDNALVNTANYRHKWSGTSFDPDNRSIKQVVADYIRLSNDEGNPKANEQIFTESTEEDGSPMETSLLDLLNIGAMDFHVARMLGLGTIDCKPPLDTYVYAAEYYTYGDLKDGLGSREVHHLYLSLPTTPETKRLPKTINITEIVPGILSSNSPEEHNTSNDGYTFDGRARFVTVLVNKEENEIPNPHFFASHEEFDRSEYTLPVLGGLEHKINDAQDWQSPELSNDPNYQHLGDGCNETVPLLISEGLTDWRNQRILYVHKQEESGIHHYLAYGIDIFSRSGYSKEIYSVETQFKATLLKPPININALLIRKEIPLMLTSHEEQNRYAAIADNSDKTLIRLVFDYHTEQELSVYKIGEEYSHLHDSQIVGNTNIYPDSFEIYANEIEIFFRNSLPCSVSGKATDVRDSNPLIATVSTDKYPLPSQGADNYLIPHLPGSQNANYAGGIFSIGEQQFIIAAVNSYNPDKPEISVYKKEISDALTDNSIPDADADNLQSPQITPDSLFTAIENMQTVSNWGENNPNSLQVQIGTSAWTVKREIFHKTVDGETVRFIEKSRGIWNNVNIEKVEEPVDQVLNSDGEVADVIYGFRGLYKLTFENFRLSQHAQYSANGNSVEWYNGIVRLKRTNAYLTNGERDLFEVIKIDNSGQNLVLYINDYSFINNTDYDQINTRTQLVNYYPGYKVYLYTNSANLTETDILPVQGEQVRYSVFGLRSKNLERASKISTPAVMFAQEQIEPVAPQLQLNAKYATRPDFFGRSSYTLTPVFEHKPNSILFYRSNDEAFLNALYEKNTVEDIRRSLEIFGGNDEDFLSNRWANFLDFDMLQQTGQYAEFPPDGDGYAFPIPDNELLITAVNNFIQWNNKEYNESVSSINQITSLNQIIIPAVAGKHGQLSAVDFIREAIYNSFVPLTEMPVVYQHIKPNEFYPEPYKPQPKKQNIKDKNGYLLHPSKPEFEMAPMAAKDETNPLNPKVIFTDFTIDGTSKNIYFYGVKEMSVQMKMSNFSPIIGPVKLVNSNPPEAPEVRTVIPILENRILGIMPAIQFEINACPRNQHIHKITLYRAFNMLDAQSVLSMKKIKEIDIEQAGMLLNEIWEFQDDFSDLEEVPYGTPLYYRITVSRKVEYMEAEDNEVITEYAPSKPSKVLITVIPDASVPDSPVLTYTSGQLANGILPDITLTWNKTVSNGKYHVYKMNAAGNWIKIKELAANSDAEINLSLANTDLDSGNLQMQNDDEQPLYHHFKVTAENSSGMLSDSDNMLTIGS